MLYNKPNSFAAKCDSLESIAVRSANLLLTYPWKVWFWGDSIGLEGLLDATCLTSRPEYRAFARGLVAGWMGREQHRRKFDYTAPGRAILQLYEETGEASLLAAATRHAEYMNGFRKTEGGAYLRYEDAAIELPPELPLNHPEHAAWQAKAKYTSDGGPCVFVDCVHFDGPFFAKLYQVTGEDRFRKDALANILPQVELLFDPEERLFHHFWIERTRLRNGVMWGRGNGWALLGIVDTLECLPPGDSGTAKLIQVLRAMAGRLRDLQEMSGGWHTVLINPDSYIETSIAAFVVDGFSRAIKAGWLDRAEFAPVVDRAFDHLLQHIVADGLLEGVSYETFPSTRSEHYCQIPRNAMVPWGQGPLLCALYSYRTLESRL